MVSDGSVLIGLLGPIAVAGSSDDAERPDRLVEVPGVRAKRLLVSLALAGGRTRSADRLITDIWGDTPPRSPHGALHTQVSRLRKILPPGTLAGNENGYRLSHCRTDIDLVSTMLSDADPTSFDRAREWWRGEPGDDLGEDSSVGTALRERVRSLEEAVDAAQLTAALARGDHQTARRVAERRCARDPLDESAHAGLMRALAGDGRTAGALAVFDRLRRRLSSELGVDPGAEVRLVYAELLATDGQGADGVVVSPPIGGSRTAGTRSARAVGLRSSATELLGREADIDAIAGMLRDGRVVTVLGPGGVGKTRVATEIGHRFHADGVPVYFVALASVRSDDDVVPAIAATLGVGESELSPSGRPRMAPGDLTARLEDVLRGHPALVILDNCEQIVDGCARVVAELTAAVPVLRILATSRTPLAVAGEQVRPLPVLDTSGVDSAAVQLFRTRAQAVRPSADLPRERIVELCRHLDGLPLAIELAAARIRTMTVDEIANRLGEKFALLRSADRTTPDRHRTLYAVIEWSWELLDEPGRDALVRLCRFPGGFRRSAAEAVTGTSGAVLDDTLESLVNQSLLSVNDRDGAARFRMLEMVREFGETRMGAEAAAHIDARMRWWARDFVVRMRDLAENGQHAAGAGGIAVEADNLTWILRSACELATVEPADDVVGVMTTVYPALAYHWTVRGLHGETRTWGARVVMALPRPPVRPDDATRQNWQMTAIVGAGHGMMTGERRVAAKARFILRRLHRAHLALDRVPEFVSDVALSDNGSRAYRVICMAAGNAVDDEVRGLALTLRAHLRENRGLVGPALRDSMAAATTMESSRYAPWFQGMWQASTASLYGQQGRYGEAARTYRIGIDLLDRLGAVEDARQIRVFLALTLLADDRPDDARRELAIITDEWDLDHEDPPGNPEVTGPALLCSAELLLAEGTRDAAAAAFARAARVIVRDHPLGVADPSVLMVVSGSVIGLVRSGDLEAAWEMVPQLVKGLDDMTIGPGWEDLPQAGTVALAFAVLWAAGRPDDGVGRQLVELALRLPGRQDYPSLRWAFETVRARAAAGDVPVTRHRRASRHGAVQTLNRLLHDQALRM
ncbi:BTAD domain-containing putative transcriptional regulator [Gordonia sp. 'Campus']|uniref:BTAD domain-containing putative transcriptional regulator n=1 Tax=Gordonia sp. 'Campus' TaxID=2915824 RepID=UPI001EE4778C|nr:BTAD domain-containing putative transcriptional regulator [Gordonia sp. 'Campus']